MSLQLPVDYIILHPCPLMPAISSQTNAPDLSTAEIISIWKFIFLWRLFNLQKSSDEMRAISSEKALDHNLQHLAPHISPKSESRQNVLRYGYSSLMSHLLELSTRQPWLHYCMSLHLLWLFHLQLQMEQVLHGFIMVLELSSSTLQTTIFGEKPLVLLIFVYMDAKKSDWKILKVESSEALAPLVSGPWMAVAS